MARLSRMTGFRGRYFLTRRPRRVRQVQTKIMEQIVVAVSALSRVVPHFDIVVEFILLEYRSLPEACSP